MLGDIGRELGERLQSLQVLIATKSPVRLVQPPEEIAREAAVYEEIDRIAARLLINEALQTAVAPDEAALLMDMRRDLEGDDTMDQLDGMVTVVDADKLAARWAAHADTRVKDEVEIVMDDIYAERRERTIAASRETQTT